MQHQLLMG